jgi:hypothetical protein
MLFQDLLPLNYSVINILHALLDAVLQELVHQRVDGSHNHLEEADLLLRHHVLLLQILHVRLLRVP